MSCLQDASRDPRSFAIYNLQRLVAIIFRIDGINCPPNAPFYNAQLVGNELVMETLQELQSWLLPWRVNVFSTRLKFAIFWSIFLAAWRGRSIQHCYVSGGGLTTQAKWNFAASPETLHWENDNLTEFGIATSESSKDVALIEERKTHSIVLEHPFSIARYSSILPNENKVVSNTN
jgi:hypothetical protein